MKRDVEHALCHYLIRKRIKAADLPDKAITIGKLANDLKREDPRWATLKKTASTQTASRSSSLSTSTSETSSAKRTTSEI
jgi:hypothetical protein